MVSAESSSPSCYDARSRCGPCDRGFYWGPQSQRLHIRTRRPTTANNQCVPTGILIQYPVHAVEITGLSLFYVRILSRCDMQSIRRTANGESRWPQRKEAAPWSTAHAYVIFGGRRNLVRALPTLASLIALVHTKFFFVLIFHEWPPTPSRSLSGSGLLNDQQGRILSIKERRLQSGCLASTLLLTPVAFPPPICNSISGCLASSKMSQTLKVLVLGDPHAAFCLTYEVSCHGFFGPATHTPAVQQSGQEETRTHYSIHYSILGNQHHPTSYRMHYSQLGNKKHPSSNRIWPHGELGD